MAAVSSLPTHFACICVTCECITCECITSQLEVTVDSMGAWEGLLAAIPPKEHRAWSERVMPRIVDGSPRWDLYRALPIGLAPHSAAEDAAAAAPSSDARPSPARRLPPPVDNSPPPQQVRGGWQPP